MEEKNYSELREYVFSQGMSLFGIADVRKIRDEFLIPNEVKTKLPYGISLGYRLSTPVLDTLIDRPNQTYFFHYQRVNMLLDTTSLRVCEWINRKGYFSFPIPASQVIDWQLQKGHVSHKKIGFLAGLGWRGRNGLLVNPTYGSQVRYVTILTDLPIKTDTPVLDECGTCTACISVCPAEAIGLTEFMLDKCTAKLKQFVKTEKISQHICGVCVKHCPGKRII